MNRETFGVSRKTFFKGWKGLEKKVKWGLVNKKPGAKRNKKK